MLGTPRCGSGNPSSILELDTRLRIGGMCDPDWLRTPDIETNSHRCHRNAASVAEFSSFIPAFQSLVSIPSWIRRELSPWFQILVQRGKNTLKLRNGSWCLGRFRLFGCASFPFVARWDIGVSRSRRTGGLLVKPTLNISLFGLRNGGSNACGLSAPLHHCGW